MTGNCEIPCAFEMHTLTVIATRLLYDKKLLYLISCVAHFILWCGILKQIMGTAGSDEQSLS